MSKILATSFFDIFKRKITYDKKLSIQQNGVDNLYTERMEALRDNSVTATMASNKMTQYIVGKGFENSNNIKIGGNILIDLLNDTADSVVDNRGVYVHVDYNANFEVSSFDILPFSHCRLGKKDSNEYNGKILIHSDWSTNPKAEEITVLDVYNNNKTIVASQIENAGGFDHYKGQVFFFNMDRKTFYPLSRINPVSNDCDSEAQASIYKNELLRRGFFGKTLVVTRPLVDDQMHNDNSAEGLQDLRNAESEREEFKSTISDFIGAEGAGGALHLEIDFEGDKLDEGILFKNIESNIDDKLFEFTENSVVNNILMSYNNLPVSLVKSPDSAMFGASGEGLRVAREMYQENTTTERMIVENVINKFTSQLDQFTTLEVLKITPLIADNSEGNDAEKLKAQATLKGSVGGVTALLQMQESVSQGVTDLSAAIEIVKEIYGIEEDKARAMLGTPKLEKV